MLVGQTKQKPDKQWLVKSVTEKITRATEHDARGADSMTFQRKGSVKVSLRRAALDPRYLKGTSHRGQIFQAEGRQVQSPEAETESWSFCPLRSGKKANVAQGQKTQGRGRSRGRVRETVNKARAGPHWASQALGFYSNYNEQTMEWTDTLRHRFLKASSGCSEENRLQWKEEADCSQGTTVTVCLETWRA